MFCKKSLLKKFAKFTGKHLRQILKKKRKFCHRCFPVNFEKFSETSFLQTTPGGCFWTDFIIWLQEKIDLLLSFAYFINIYWVTSVKLLQLLFKLQSGVHIRRFRLFQIRCIESWDVLHPVINKTSFKELNLHLPVVFMVTFCCNSFTKIRWCC